MSIASRLKSLGLAGRKGALNNQGVSDPYIQQFVIPVTLVASTAEQDTGFVMPVRASELHVGVNVITEEATGTFKTIDVGVVGSPDALIDDGSVDAKGFIGATGGAGEQPSPVDLSGKTIAYALGSADFAELEAEIVITVIGASVS